MNDDSSQKNAIEPILSAFGAASKPVGDWYPSESSEPALPDERVHRLIGRLAKRCFARMEALRRSAYLLGQDVGRAVRLYSRGEGLSALAERIEKEFGKHVTPQTLGNALNIFQSYSRDEYENRFSELKDTHLLKAQQLKGDIREERNRSAHPCPPTSGLYLDFSLPLNPTARFRSCKISFRVRKSSS